MSGSGEGIRSKGEEGEGRVRLQAKSGVMARRPSSDTAGLLVVSVRRGVRLWMIEVCGGRVRLSRVGVNIFP